MSWQQTWSFKLAFALDLFGAAIFFGHFGFSISTMAGLVRRGLDGPLNLRPWQRRFLLWLEPKLSWAHCAGALKFDRARAQFALDNTPKELPP